MLWRLSKALQRGSYYASHQQSRWVSSLPSPQTKTYHLQAVSSGSCCVSSTESGHAVTSDLPRVSGGSDTAAEPVYLLLAALCGCEAATAQFVAYKMKISLGDIRFKLEATRDQRGALSLPLGSDIPVPSRLQLVTGTAMVESDATDTQLAELEREVHVRCPVANMLVASGAVLDVRFEREPAQRSNISSKSSVEDICLS